MMKQVSMRPIAAKSCMYHPKLLRVIMAHEMTPEVERNYQLCVLHGTSDEHFIQWLVESIYPLSFLTKKNHYRIGSIIMPNERMFRIRTIRLHRCGI